MSLEGATRKAVHFSFLVLAPLLTMQASALANDQKLVFAAASLTRPLNEILMLYNAANDDGAVASYASSGTLARQIQNGAEPAIFVSANRSWVTDLVQSGHIALQDVSEIASNTLVVIAPIKHNKRLRDGEDVLTRSRLTRALDGERLAMADPNHAPVGRYGRQALQALDLWSIAAPRLATAQHASAAVNMVARGEAVLGITYRSDTIGVEAVRVANSIDPALHDPITYIAAPLKHARRRADVEKLLGFLRSDAAQRILSKHGFQTRPTR